MKNAQIVDGVLNGRSVEIFRKAALGKELLARFGPTGVVRECPFIEVEQTLQLRAPVRHRGRHDHSRHGQLLGKRRCLQRDLLVSGLSD